MNPKIFLTIILIFNLICLSFSQTVIEMTHPTDAQLVLLKVDKKEDADIVVYKTRSNKESRKWDCLWKFKNWGFANLSIFILKNISDTTLYKDDENGFVIDGKIFFTENKDERGYNDTNYRLKNVFRKFKEAPPGNKIDSIKNIAPVSYLVSFIGNLNFSDSPKIFPSDIRIAIVDSALVNTFGVYKPDSNNFKFKQQLYKGSYNILITANNYRQYVKTYKVTENDSSLNKLINVTLISNVIATNENKNLNIPAKEEVLVVNNLFFDFAKYSLRQDSKNELDKTAKIMKLNPTIKLELVGYTDSKGSKEYNLKLSKLRAKAAVKYLMKKGISNNRLIYKGMGKKKPIALNISNGKDCIDGRKLNRRVEIKLVNAKQAKIKVETIKVPENLQIEDNRNK